MKIEIYHKENKFSIKAVINHEKIAASLGHRLRPTIEILFGKPSYEYYLMKETQLTSLFVPLNFSIWQARNGKTYVSYWYPKRNIAHIYHFKSKEAQHAITAISHAMDIMTKMATQ